MLCERLSFLHTHTHTRARARARRHEHARARTRAHARTHKQFASIRYTNQRCCVGK